MSTFVLKIELGNDAMRTHRDVSAALNHAARGIREDSTWDGSIIDANGNPVGWFELRSPSGPQKRIRGDKLRQRSWDIAADEYEAGTLTLAELIDRVRDDGPAEKMVAAWAAEDGESLEECGCAGDHCGGHQHHGAPESGTIEG